jgi:hypothetical protein
VRGREPVPQIVGPHPGRDGERVARRLVVQVHGCVREVDGPGAQLGDDLQEIVEAGLQDRAMVDEHGARERGIASREHLGDLRERNVERAETDDDRRVGELVDRGAPITARGVDARQDEDAGLVPSSSVPVTKPGTRRVWSSPKSATASHTVPAGGSRSNCFTVGRTSRACGLPPGESRASGTPDRVPVVTLLAERDSP